MMTQSKALSSSASESQFPLLEGSATWQALSFAAIALPQIYLFTPPQGSYTAYIQSAISSFFFI